jgi:hypothetical protein
MPISVLSGMMAVPPFALLGWVGLVLPGTTVLHQVAGALLMSAFVALVLVIIGAQMCRIVALPVPPLVVLPAVVILPVLAVVPSLVISPLRPLIERLPIAKRTSVFGFRFASDDSGASTPPADTAGT